MGLRGLRGCHDNDTLRYDDGRGRDKIDMIDKIDTIEGFKGLRV